MSVIKVYNVDQIVEILKPLGISRPSIYRAIGTKMLKSVKVGRKFVVSEEALNNFLNGQTVNE